MAKRCFRPIYPLSRPSGKPSSSCSPLVCQHLVSQRTQHKCQRFILKRLPNAASSYTYCFQLNYHLPKTCGGVHAGVGRSWALFHLPVPTHARRCAGQCQEHPSFNPTPNFQAYKAFLSIFPLRLHSQFSSTRDGLCIGVGSSRVPVYFPIPMPTTSFQPYPPPNSSVQSPKSHHIRGGAHV